MNEVIQLYCNDCGTCDIKRICESVSGDFINNRNKCKEAYDIITSSMSDEDIINHPNHYTNGGIECIDEMILVFGKDVVANFCLCNVWKYRYRSLTKNGEEDIKKSHWYMKKYKELINSECY